jgi:hypothetical protein
MWDNGQCSAGLSTPPLPHDHSPWHTVIKEMIRWQTKFHYRYALHSYYCVSKYVMAFQNVSYQYCYDLVYQYCDNGCIWNSWYRYICTYTYTYMQYLNFQFLYDLRHHVMSTSVQEHEQVSIPRHIRNGKSKILRMQISE